MKKFLSNVKGVAAVEFALTAALFFFVFFMNLELTRLAITSSQWDLMIAQSVRAARNANPEDGNYEKVFLKELEEQRDNVSGIMRFFVYRQTKLFQIGTTVKVDYADCERDEKTCIDAILNERFRQPTKDKDGNPIAPASGIQATLARYKLVYSYEFDSVLPFLPKEWIENTLTREFIVLQEYQRSAFQPTRVTPITSP